MIRIRAFEPGDLAVVTDLEAANRPNPWPAEVFAGELASHDRVYVVAEDDAVVGFGGVVVAGEEAHVTNVLVDPAHRRRGIGRKLMVALIEAAVARGARHLRLEVRSENDPALKLYGDLGLVPVGVRPGYYGDDDALILWAHDIDRSSYLESLG